ncbi:hypothetical protein [Brunnivagina elsteri]|uniref:hypothetical protein n=1 Tax=Brunnivagina elsteri TaxID=1247191 RepID=UPI001FE29BCE|nr:hypothetical protein [Calothrix elsteri]
MNTIATSYTQIEFQHLREWHESGVDTEITHLNVKSLEGRTPYEYLIYSPKISRRNDGRLRDGDLTKYRHIEHGGWWCKNSSQFVIRNSQLNCELRIANCELC